MLKSSISRIDTNEQGQRDQYVTESCFLSCLVFYFCEGQKLFKNDASTSDNIFAKRRRLIALLIPIFVVNSFWWTYMGVTNSFGLFEGQTGVHEIPRFYLSITALFGSMIAGATSEGMCSSSLKWLQKFDPRFSFASFTFNYTFEP